MMNCTINVNKNFEHRFNKYQIGFAAPLIQKYVPDGRKPSDQSLHGHWEVAAYKILYEAIVSKIIVHLFKDYETKKVKKTSLKWTLGS